MELYEYVKNNCTHDNCLKKLRAIPGDVKFEDLQKLNTETQKLLHIKPGTATISSTLQPSAEPPDNAGDSAEEENYNHSDEDDHSDEDEYSDTEEYRDEDYDSYIMVSSDDEV